MNLQESIQYLEDYRYRIPMGDYDYQDFGRIIKCLRDIQDQSDINQQLVNILKEKLK